jgi:hypothetical protein
MEWSRDAKLVLSTLDTLANQMDRMNDRLLDLVKSTDLLEYRINQIEEHYKSMHRTTNQIEARREVSNIDGSWKVRAAIVVGMFALLQIMCSAVMTFLLK